MHRYCRVLRHAGFEAYCNLVRNVKGHRSEICNCLHQLPAQLIRLPGDIHISQDDIPVSER